MGMRWLPDCATRSSGEILYTTGRVRLPSSDIGSRNCVEFVFAIVALVGHEAKVAQTALTGGILTNTLLILGTCFFMGGFQKHTQTYPAILARLKSTLLIIGVASLMLPTAHKLCAEGMPHCNSKLLSSSDV
jgi:calcium/proton exchanger cax